MVNKLPRGGFKAVKRGVFRGVFGAVKYGVYGVIGIIGVMGNYL